MYGFPLENCPPANFIFEGTGASVTLSLNTSFKFLRRFNTSNYLSACFDNDLFAYRSS